MAKMLFRFRFAEADRERYGDGTFELDVSPDGLSRIQIGVLERFEDETGMQVLGDWLDRLGRNELRAVRAFMWLARATTEPQPEPLPFAKFEPDVIAVINGPDFEYIFEADEDADADAEGNATSPAPNRATRRQSPKRSSSSSTKSPRRASGS